jgi:hypothetical protein
MDSLLRFTTTHKKDPAIARWLNQLPLELALIADPWFLRMRQCGADVCELLHDGCPVVCVGDAPFAYVNAFRNHVNVGFFYGASLPDPAGLLEGSGKRGRHVKLRPDSEVDNAALAALIKAAYLDIRARIAEL